MPQYNLRSSNRPVRRPLGEITPSYAQNKATPAQRDQPNQPGQIRHEYSEFFKGRAIQEVDTRPKGDTVAAACKRVGVAKSTVLKWKKEIREGIPYAEDPRQRTGALRKSKPTSFNAEKSQEIVHAPQWKRKQNWHWQTKHYKLDCHWKTTRRLMLQRSQRWGLPKAGKYKEAKIKKLSQLNQDARQAYAWRHANKPLEFWQRVFFTDEGHFDPSEGGIDTCLRELGTRYEPENMKPVDSKRIGNQIHFGSWINWHAKGPLVFYNVQVPPLENPEDPEPPKQQRKKHAEWAARQPQVEVTPTNNSMTQHAYLNTFLEPVYWLAIEKATREGLQPILQEDNDASHGTRSTHNPCYQFKQQHKIETLEHPANSPDLNPKEACINYLKLKVKQQFVWKGNNLEEAKQLLIDTWEAMDQKSIQKRIKEMPGRCIKVSRDPSKIVKSKLW